MAAQQNLLRALKLIRLLKQRPGKTLPQLAQLLDCDPRHARRFLDTLEEVGFFVEKEGSRPPRFFLFEDERRKQAELTTHSNGLFNQFQTNVYQMIEVVVCCMQLHIKIQGSSRDP
jgi:proteasome accessory factor C